MEKHGVAWKSMEKHGKPWTPKSLTEIIHFYVIKVPN